MTLADIPPEVGLFPLSGVLLLPRGKLPLNVFEPRYIALVEDALASHRLIGLIQPRWQEDEDEGNEAPPLYTTGCLGRLTSMTERADGTYAMTLTGLLRFRLLRETGLRRGYRVARIDVSSFAGDLNEIPSEPFDRTQLLNSLKNYFQKKRAECPLVPDRTDGRQPASGDFTHDLSFPSGGKTGIAGCRKSDRPCAGPANTARPVRSGTGRPSFLTI